MFHVEQTQKFISKSDLGIGLTTPLARLSASFIMMACGFNRINDLLSDYVASDATEVVSEILKRIDVAVNILEGDRLKIPKQGGFMAVSNYPHGILDLLIMAYVIKKVRPDARFLFKNELFNMPFINDLTLISSNEPIADATVVRKALDHVKAGHPLIVFPAQQSASYSKGFSGVVDNSWNQAIFKIARLVDVPLQSFYINGGNSSFYLTLRKLSDPISSAMIVRELLSRQFSNITVAISDPFTYSDIIDQTSSKALKSSQKDAIVARYTRALTFIQEQKFDTSPTSITTKPQKTIVGMASKVLLFEKDGYKAYINDENTEVLYQKGGKNILSFTVSRVVKGRHTESNWFKNFDLSRSSSSLVERDAVEIFNISYRLNWNYIDVEFISETFKYIARLFGVQNIIIQDSCNYCYSQSTAYTLYSHLLERNYSQLMRNRVVVPRSPLPSLKPISYRMAQEVLYFPNISTFSEEIKKVLPFEISPIISATTFAGGRYIASAAPTGRNTEIPTPCDEKIKDSVAVAAIETISQSVNLMLITI